jgi:hypothetical protein
VKKKYRVIAPNGSSLVIEARSVTYDGGVTTFRVDEDTQVVFERGEVRSVVGPLEEKPE